ncbi:MAG: hypothetical protein M1832_004110 [Thelocarpon impressellum]|nr:MAG: hypothetical protein M1832_004110 [Thelocarpon impressellum]
MSQEPPPFHTVIDFSVMTGCPDSTLTAMCNGKRFHVIISGLSLGGAVPGPQSEYFDLLDALEKAENSSHKILEALEDWILERCIPHFKRLAPQIPGDAGAPRTLQQYYRPETFVLSLVNRGNHVEAVRRSSSGSESVQQAEPRLRPSPSTPHMDSSLPRFKASALDILPTHPDSDITADLPRRIRCPDGRQYFFKAVLDPRSFDRELESLLHIERAGLPSQKTRTSRLRGIVEWDEDDTIMGMLLDYIDGGNHTLQTAARGASAACREKWMSQIENIVRQLHQVGIVWGDVKPDNIVIDGDSNAHVVDFGGGCAIGWVDHKLYDTVEGDQQGMQRLRAYLASAQEEHSLTD